MAGDWIKMRSDLFTHPKVVRMSSALEADTLRTVGGLMSAWCLFDAHSEDGKLIGYTPGKLDDHVRWPGFSAAMMAIRWLDIGEVDGVQCLVLPEFYTHNGQSAKRRAQDKDRKQSVRKLSASDADKMRTREEKRREDLKASLSPAGAQAQGDDPPAVVVTDGDGNPVNPAASPITLLNGEQGAHMVTACRALRKMSALQFNPGSEELATLLLDGFTAEQIVRCAAEKALRSASLLNDPDIRDDLAEVFINGGTQADMGLTDKQHTALRSAISQISVSYVAATLRGRRRDAVEQAQGARAGPPAGKPRKPAANDNFKGTTYVGTAIDKLPPELRDAVAQLGEQPSA